MREVVRYLSVPRTHHPVLFNSSLLKFKIVLESTFAHSKDRFLAIRLQHSGNQFFDRFFKKCRLVIDEKRRAASIIPITGGK
jgi:hypothetical protein